MSNGPTESTNNLIKRIAFGFRNYRTRLLLYVKTQPEPTPQPHSSLKSEGILNPARQPLEVATPYYKYGEIGKTSGFVEQIAEAADRRIDDCQ